MSVFASPYLFPGDGYPVASGCWQWIRVPPSCIATVRVNGAEVPGSTAVSREICSSTKPGFLANRETEGSCVLIQGESLVKFQGNDLLLEHGSV